MLNHELTEYGLMNTQKIPYIKAHEEATKLYNYTKYVKELDLKEGIK